VVGIRRAPLALPLHRSPRGSPLRPCGTCGYAAAREHVGEVSQCGGNPYGWWAGSFISLDPRFVYSGTKDFPFDAAFITVVPNGAGQRVENVVGSVPSNFFSSGAPTNESWTAYAYAARVQAPTAQSLQPCPNAKPPAKTSLDSDHVAIVSCDFGFPYPAYPNGPIGASGGPFVNSANVLPHAIGAIAQRYYQCSPGNGFFTCPEQFHGLAMTTPAAQLYLVAALP
jgi:hypothetical protein